MRESIIWVVSILAVCLFIGYSCVGTEGKVGMIKESAPHEIKLRGWDIMRYEGYQRGSWGNHGGKVWYHVKDINNENIQYRVYVTEWNGELHYHYGEPEKLQRLEVNYPND